MSVYRTFLFAPGNHPRRVEKALSLDADAVILDLEDACPIAEKVATRAVVVAACQKPRAGLGYIRVNATTTEFGFGDIAAVVQKGVDGIVLPKVEAADEIRSADWTIASLEKKRGLPVGRCRSDPDHRDGQGHGEHSRDCVRRHARQAHRLRCRRLHARHEHGVDAGRDRAAALPQRVRAGLAGSRHRGAARHGVGGPQGPGGLPGLGAPRQGARLPGQDVHPSRPGARRQRGVHPVRRRGRVVAQGGRGLRGGREGGLRLHSARGQVHRLPDRLSRPPRPGDDGAHRRAQEADKGGRIMANEPAAVPLRPRGEGFGAGGIPHRREFPPSRSLPDKRDVRSSNRQAAAGHPHPRRVELPRRAVLRDAARRVRRRGDQDRAAEGR